MNYPQSKLRGIRSASLRKADIEVKVKSHIHPPCKQGGVQILISSPEYFNSKVLPMSLLTHFVQLFAISDLIRFLAGHFRVILLIFIT